VFAVAAALLALTTAYWLPWIGTALEGSGSPRKADIAVVLGGDQFGNRILKGAELARGGYVPKVFVSGPSGNYGLYECELAIAFAVKRGFPQSLFICGRNETRSTRDEATVIVPELRRLGVKSFLLVTSDFHTRRAGRLFRAAAPDLQMTVVAAEDAEFHLDRWWQAREGRKAVVLEWSKTVATWFGM
jgi:uncharacterized SAM-binding protein YcdF (DUF218 family)